jgi:NAD(P)H-flavin reductase
MVSPSSFAPHALPALALSVAGADVMQPRFLRVLRRRAQTADTFTFWLEAASGAPAQTPGSGFGPGQFNMIGVPGYAEVPISISGDPAKPELEHTIRSVGSATRALERLRRGDWVAVRGPFGIGWPLERAVGRELLIVAGGIGLAPLKPAIHAALSERRVASLVVVYGARSPRDLLFRREIESWARRAGVQVSVTVDRGDPGWTGHTGVVTKLLERVRFNPGQALAFLCGPEVMLRYCARELERLGMPDADIYLSVERNMKCGVGICGHCQLGPLIVCRDGPVVAYDRLRPLLNVAEL